MIFVALSEAADRGELELRHGGFCRWHRRQRDGVVVVREILVLPEYRGMGVGRELLGIVAGKNTGAVIRAVCPESYPANGFWARMGYAEVSRADGRVTWERRS